MCNGLIEVVIKCGYRPYVMTRNKIGKTSYKKDGKSITIKNIGYVINVNTRKYVKNINKYFSIVKNWTGEVGCLELTKNYTLYIRRNGNCIWTGNCRHCIKAYLTNGIGSQPKIFKLSTLEANGTNVGKKVNDWLPVVGGMHPYCRCNLHKLLSGQEWDEEKKEFRFPENDE
jgi:hypothetical protein